jgi:hypothetical protein
MPADKLSLPLIKVSLPDIGMTSSADRQTPPRFRKSFPYFSLFTFHFSLSRAGRL